MLWGVQLLTGGFQIGLAEILRAQLHQGQGSRDILLEELNRNSFDTVVFYLGAVRHSYSMEPPNRSSNAATQTRSNNTQPTGTTTFFPNCGDRIKKWSYVCRTSRRTRGWERSSLPPTRPPGRHPQLRAITGLGDLRNGAKKSTNNTNAVSSRRRSPFPCGQIQRARRLLRPTRPPRTK